MNVENRQRFFEYAQTQIPRESCGLLIIEKGRERLVIARNKSTADDQFILDPADFRAAEDRGEVVGVVHSHCFIAATPSAADRVSCEASGLPWYICSVPTGTWAEFKPSGYKAPLIGRPFAHGILDCYALIRDYYREKLGIELLNFDREVEWWDKGWNLFAENFEKAGFFEVNIKDIREHDCLLMQIHAKVMNHGGVYIGNDMFLHHLNKRLSSRDPFAGYYRKHTIKVVRYKGL